MKKYLLVGVVGITVLFGALWWGIHTGHVALPHIPERKPSLTREVTFRSGLQNTDVIRSKIGLDKDALKKNLKDLDAWLDLAIQYKQAGDTNGAIEIWKYLDEAFPSEHTSAFNLGVVYNQDVKDYKRSEQYYREAIQRGPTDPLSYLGLHELYRYSYKQDSTATADVLVEGMKAVSTDANMPIALAAYYRDDKKDYPTAITYIRKAIDVLKATQGDKKKIQALEGEITRLSK